MNRNSALILVIIALLLFQSGAITPEMIDKIKDILTPRPTPVDPVDPVDPDDPPPIDLDGFNVLIITDRSAGSALDENVTRDDKLRDYLEEHCDEFHVWDDSFDDWKYVDDAWQEAYDDALDEADGKLPWIVVSGDKSGTSEELPDSVDGVISLLDKFRG